MNRSWRSAAVSVLIAAAALLAAVGGTEASQQRDSAPWYIAAGLVLGLGLAIAAWPESGRVSPLVRLGYRLEAWRLSRKRIRGWGPTAFAVPRGTLLGIASVRQDQAVAGFLCEVLTPLGRFSAYSREAAEAFSLQRQQGRSHVAALDLPQPMPWCWLLFPESFNPQAPDPHNLPYGRYWVLWWAWERDEDGFSVRLRFVVVDSFVVGRPILVRRRRPKRPVRHPGVEQGGSSSARAR